MQPLAHCGRNLSEPFPWVATEVRARRPLAPPLRNRRCRRSPLRNVAPHCRFGSGYGQGRKRPPVNVAEAHVGEASRTRRVNRRRGSRENTANGEVTNGERRQPAGGGGCAEIVWLPERNPLHSEKRRISLRNSPYNPSGKFTLGYKLQILGPARPRRRSGGRFRRHGYRAGQLFSGVAAKASIRSRI
jgi:hypothetical protein